MVQQVAADENVPIISQMAKLIELSGPGPTTVSKFQTDVDRQRLSAYMSWDENGELEVK
jgi:hypothetical protein